MARQMNRERQSRVMSEFDWRNDDIIWGDPVARQAERQSKLTKGRKESLERYHQKTGRDTRQDFNTKYGEV